MHGKGTMDYGSGDRFTGIWVNGNRTGQGVHNFVNGDRYEGQWKDDKQHGKGTLVWGPNSASPGDKYVGDWIDGNRSGQGVYTDADGNRYELRHSQISR
jgi:hypothetical protein